MIESATSFMNHYQKPIDDDRDGFENKFSIPTSSSSLSIEIEQPESLVDKYAELFK